MSEPTSDVGNLCASLAQAEIGPAPIHVPVDDSTINYGALARNLEGSGPEKMYITTAIAYTNGFPHVGHAYEFLTADALVRYYRVLGYDTYFLTGTDEHGQKVAASAEKCNRTPLEHCNVYANAFTALMQRLLVTHSRFIRTTNPQHEATAQRLWEMCAAAGDIYLSTYEGWYNEREELFVTDMEAEEAGFIDKASGLPLKRVQEESYFFRMSKYADRLLEHISANPEFIQPEQYRNSIIARLTNDALKDLSISRTTFSWGIPVPEGFDKKHVMYVWFDALSNYLSGVNALSDDSLGYWPAGCHIIGKDIVWFHSVIWPCMLMSANVALPRTVFSHGFVNDAEGRRMSKSLGNTIDPHQVLDLYPVDSVRYYCCASTSYGTDLDFSDTNLATMHNGELADTLGNLVNRALNLCHKFCGGVIPDTTHDAEFGLPFSLTDLEATIRADIAKYSLNTALFRAMDAVRATNRFLTVAEPWKMKGDNECRRPAIVRTTLEAIYIFTHFLAPVIPQAAAGIFERLNTAPKVSRDLRADFYNLSVGTPVTVGEILFTKVEDANEKAKAAAEKAMKEKAAAKAALKQKQKKAEDVDLNQHDFSKIELRVGRIVHVWNHATADRLYCEEIDVGEETPRQIASGLREHYTLEQMLDRRVVVVCNLKEAKLQGFASNGMVLASKCDGKVELVEPPAEASIGERLMLPGVTGEPWPASKVKKMKVWEEFAPHLRANGDGVACWKDEPMHTTAGTCTVPTIRNAPIS